MLQILLRNKKKVVSVVLLVLLLALIRLFEKQLFYDPFLDFFKGEFQIAQLPEYKSVPLFFGLVFRYFLNSVISIAVIYVVFKDLLLTKFTSALYLIFFLVLIGLFFGILKFSGQPDYMLLFYVRRFLIQPLFLVLFLPAFYYQKKNK
ncbi:exosortase F-associated protein [Flavobacterium cauense R2A-7]|uniref:Exosortase F-associated protein n=1 Tax=Flavobacterium cauense R2A-7 TaxID=1341154 RepID=A0A562M402_9FLAO|nr:exosortase F system-associated protein [Flavobacterium cauense]KGO83992.1 membrane protein [Flavobacterium cauense R2A-7]TWI14666.1 exosortase F-associated protein [Flavobacterium cauense R2A-7]